MGCRELPILVPLRGADPKLRETLLRLLRQDYPRFEIHVIVDNPNDPAYSIANQVLAEHGPTNMHVRWIEDRRTTCGLQCSALYEAMEHVDDDVEIIVGIDGDVLTHPTWMRELVEPFGDESVGVTHGNRWFTPSEDHLGRIGSLSVERRRGSADAHLSASPGAARLRFEPRRFVIPVSLRIGRGPWFTTLPQRMR